jgi:RNA polymerase sigma-70 factor, ECF subfamily
MPGVAPGGQGDLDRLLAAAGRGDLGAFDLIYQELHGPVFGVVRSLLRDQAQSEEVTQEVLLEIWRMAFRFDTGKGSAAAWALTIARRRAIDRVRSAAATGAREQRAAMTEVSWDEVSEAVQDSLDYQRLRACLAKLTDLQQEAVMLAFYGGYSYPEVASILGIPVATAKTRIRDALIRLRQLMQDL